MIMVKMCLFCGNNGYNVFICCFNSVNKGSVKLFGVDILFDFINLFEVMVLRKSFSLGNFDFFFDNGNGDLIVVVEDNGYYFDG